MEASQLDVQHVYAHKQSNLQNIAEWSFSSVCFMLRNILSVLQHATTEDSYLDTAAIYVIPYQALDEE